MGSDIFISYSRKDEGFVRILRKTLEQKRLSCWVDKGGGISAGEDWSEAIAKGIKESLAFVFVFSSNSEASYNVRDEIVLAAKNSLTIIPIRLEDIAPTGFFDLRLSRYNWVDIFGETQEQLDEVCDDIARTVKKMRPLAEAGRSPMIDASQTQRYTADENKYINKMKEFLSDGETSEIEKEQLSAIAEVLCISLERSNELEQEIKAQLELGRLAHLNNEERKYIIKLKEFLEDGEISEKERLLLETIGETLGIDEERAATIEASIVEHQLPKHGYDDIQTGVLGELEPCGTEYQEAITRRCDAVEALEQPTAAGERERKEDEGQTDLVGLPGVGEQRKRVSYSNWEDFIEGESRTDPVKKMNAATAAEIHHLLLDTLGRMEMAFEVRYGGGTISFRVPKDLAKSASRVFARIGLLDFSRRFCYLDTLSKKPRDEVPAGAMLTNRSDKTKYAFRVPSLDEFEKVKDSMKDAVVKSYIILSRKKR